MKEILSSLFDLAVVFVSFALTLIYLSKGPEYHLSALCAFVFTVMSTNKIYADVEIAKLKEQINELKAKIK